MEENNVALERFVRKPGRPPGTGPASRLKKKRDTNQFQERFLALIKAKHFDRVYFALLNAAVRGDAWAIKYYLDRVLGKPVQAINVEQNVTQDVSPEQVRDELMTRVRELTALNNN